MVKRTITGQEAENMGLIRHEHYNMMPAKFRFNVTKAGEIYLSGMTIEANPKTPGERLRVATLAKLSAREVNDNLKKMGDL